MATTVATLAGLVYHGCYPGWPGISRWLSWLAWVSRGVWLAWCPEVSGRPGVPGLSQKHVVYTCFEVQKAVYSIFEVKKPFIAILDTKSRARLGSRSDYSLILGHFDTKIMDLTSKSMISGSEGPKIRECRATLGKPSPWI